MWRNDARSQTSLGVPLRREALFAALRVARMQALRLFAHRWPCTDRSESALYSSVCPEACGAKTTFVNRWQKTVPNVEGWFLGHGLICYAPSNYSGPCARQDSVSSLSATSS